MGNYPRRENALSWRIHRHRRNARGIYKELTQQLAPFVLQIANYIYERRQMPDNWTDGAAVHIREKSSTAISYDCRPIFLTRIIYKIWPELQTARIARTLHILTTNNQHGYMHGLSAIDAVMKIAQAISAGPRDFEIIAMCLSKAFIV